MAGGRCGWCAVTLAGMDHELAEHPCQARCAWTANGRYVDAAPVFSCAGCGSEWARTQAWTPIDANGFINPLILAERAHPPQPC